LRGAISRNCVRHFSLARSTWAYQSFRAPMTARALALPKDSGASVANAAGDEIPPLSIACRGLLVLFAVGLSVGFCAGFLLLKDPLGPYLTNNDMRPAIRRFVLGVAFGAAGLATVSGLVAAFWLRRVAPPADTLRRIAYRSAPLGAAGFLPLLFNWEAWRSHDLEFLTLVALSALSLEAGMWARAVTEPTGPELFVEGHVRRLRSDIAARFPSVAARAPLGIVCAGALVYAVYFAYVTIAWHRSVRSSYDLAVENNLLWNLVHGGPFFKSSPMGPTGSRFGQGATLFAYVIAPLYALYQRPETLYVLQATLLGAAAIPLFYYARLYVGGAASCLLALAYLMFPGLHGANLYEFHYLPLSTFFVWLALFALESRRDVLAAVAVVLALATSEDVALALVAFGVYLLVCGKRPRAGLVVALTSALYFVAMKLWIVPHVTGTDSLATAYQRLLPTGEDGFGAVVRTVIANPWYTVGTVLETDKLTFAMQMLVPLALVPLRRSITLLLALPALFFTVLSSAVSFSSIHYQFTAHWTTFLFVATVLSLSKQRSAARRGSLCAIALATLACSYQYGAVLQRHTATCGPIPFKFGMDREGRARGQALASVLQALPPRAKVSCSAFTTPQVSSRPDAYSLTIGVFDAQYILFPTSRTDFVGSEYGTVTGLLQSSGFGVVAVAPPFALAGKGQANLRNAEVLGMMR